MGFEGPRAESDEMYAAMVFNNIFGNGMSSRLFQRIREEKGLVYSIYSYLSTFVDTGIYVISAGMAEENLEEVIKIIYEEIDRAKSEILDDQTLYKAKEQLKGNYILGLENISARMQSIGRAQMTFGKVETPEQIIARIDEVTTQAVHSFVKNTFDYSKMAASVIGNIQKKDVKRLLDR